MNIMRKLSSVFRGSVRESGEALVDQNALRIFGQEIVDAEKSIHYSKLHLSQVMAERYQLDREQSSICKLIEKREAQVAAALEKNALPLAEEIAEDILLKRASVNDINLAITELKERERSISASIQAGVQQLQGYRRELVLAKAISSANKASAVVGTDVFSLDNSLSDLKSSVSRLKSRQLRNDDAIKAMKKINVSMGDEGIDRRIEAEGLGSRNGEVQALLAQIRKKAESSIHKAESSSQKDRPMGE